MAIRKLLLTLCLLAGLWGRSDPLQTVQELYQRRAMSELIPAAQALLDNPAVSLADKSRLRLYLGEAFRSLHKPQEAILHLLEVERTDPQSPLRLDAYLQLQELYRGDPLRYQSYLEKIFTGFPKTDPAVAAGKELAGILIQSKTYTKAIEVLETLFKLWKVEDGQGILQMQLAIAHAGLRDYIEAADYLDVIEKRHRALLIQNPAFTLTAASIHYNTQQFEPATALLTQLINVHPDFPQLLDAAMLLAQSLDRSKNPYLAAVTLIQALRRRSPGGQRHDLLLLLGQLLSQLPVEDREQLARNYPTLSDSDKLLRQVYANAQDINLKRQANQILARDLRNRQLPDQASALYLDYLSKNRETTVIKQLRECLDEWLALIAANRDNESLRRFWQSFHNRKSFLSGSNLINLARLLIQNEEFFPAALEVLAHIRRYKMYRSHWPEAQEHMIDILIKTQRWEEAEQELAKAKDRVHGESRFRWFAWRLAKRSKAGGVSESILLSALPSFDPKDRTSWDLHLAAVDKLIDKKEYGFAFNRLQNMAGQTDISADMHLELTRRFALLAFHRGELETALQLYRELAASPKEEPWALFRQVSILRLLNRQEEARLTAESLKSRHPESYWSRQIP